jgi:hypothetical protein
LRNCLYWYNAEKGILYSSDGLWFWRNDGSNPLEYEDLLYRVIFSMASDVSTQDSLEPMSVENGVQQLAIQHLVELHVDTVTDASYQIINSSLG